MTQKFQNSYVTKTKSIKAIVSSQTLYHTMPMGTRKLKLTKDKLYFAKENGEVFTSMFLETLAAPMNEYPFIEIDITQKQAKCILNVLNAIPEQPITILIDESNFGISSMVF